MSWYAAHIVMAVRSKRTRQQGIPVWENIVLIQADSEQQAFDKAQARGRRDEGDDDGSMTWAGEPAAWVFAGVRKLTNCEPHEKRPGDLTEITYNEFELESELDLRRFVEGRPAPLRTADQFHEPTGADDAATSATARKKRA